MNFIQSRTHQETDHAIKILIIDDQQLFIDSLTYVLNTLPDKVQITQTNSVYEGINKLNKSNSFDIILLDLNIPGSDSLAFLHHMELNEIFVPVVMISAEQDIERIQHGLELGSMGFIPKSYSADKMKSALKSILEGNLYLPADLPLSI